MHKKEQNFHKNKTKRALKKKTSTLLTMFLFETCLNACVLMNCLILGFQYKE